MQDTGGRIDTGNMELESLDLTIFTPPIISDQEKVLHPEGLFLLLPDPANRRSWT
jgi:hypothetical protein